MALAAGCGSDNGSGSVERTDTTAAPAAAPPYGIYVREVSAADVERTAKSRDDSDPNQRPPTPGTYRLEIEQSGQGDAIKTVLPEGFFIPMNVRFNESATSVDAVSYTDAKSASFCGPAIEVRATYSFTVTDGGFTLKPDGGDPCADRDSVWTGKWKKR